MLATPVVAFGVLNLGAAWHGPGGGFEAAKAVGACSLILSTHPGRARLGGSNRFL